MTILTIILGIMLIIGGLSCMFTPLLTFIDAGWLFVILLMVFGIIGIIRGVIRKDYGVDFVFSIISVVLAIIITCVPGLVLVNEGILIYLMAAWILIEGIFAIVTSIKYRGIAGGSWWILGLIVGILGALIGIYSFVHPLVLAVAVGFLIGAYFVITGIDAIVIAAEISSVKKTVKQVKKSRKSSK